MKYSIRYFIFILSILLPSLSNSQIIRNLRLAPGAMWRNENGNNEYTLNFTVEDNVNNNKQECVTIDGWPDPGTGIARTGYWNLGDYPQNGDKFIKIYFRGWEDDVPKRCNHNDGDDGDCEETRNEALDYTTYVPFKEHDVRLNWCNRFVTLLKFSWEPPALTYDLKDAVVGGGCGNISKITLKSSKAIFGGKHYWEYDDGSGWQFLALTDINTYTFTTPSYNSQTKLRFRVAPYINKTICQFTEFPDALDIYPPPPTDFQFKVNNILCKGAKNGSIEIGDVTGNYSSYYVLLRNTANNNTLDIYNHPKSGTKNYFTGLDVGTYEIRVLNNILMNDELKQVCSFSKFVTITEPTTKVIFNNPAFSASNYNGYNVSCFNGTNAEITLASSGGTGSHTYSLDNITYHASSKFSNLKAGNHTLYVKDQNGCFPDVLPTATLTQPPSLRSNVAVTEYYINTHLKCYGDNSGKMDLIIRGGVSPYRTSVNNSSFVQGKTTYENLTAGDYNIKIYDNNDCFVESSRSLYPPLPLTFSEKSLVPPTCNGSSDGSISLNLNGGITYLTKGYSATFTDPNGDISLKAGNAFQFTDLKKGSYTFRSTDDLGCSKDTTVIVNEPAPVTASITHADVACKGGSTGYIYTNASGGSDIYTYKITESSGKELGEITYPGKGILVNKLPKGNYTIGIVDSKGCKPKTPYTQKISEPEFSLDLLSEKVSTVKCFGESNGEIKVKGAGGWSTYTYSIDGKNFATSQTFSNLKEGKYKLYVNDKLNCKDSLEVKVSQPERLVSSVYKIEDVKCFSGADGSISLTTKGGTKPYRFSKNNGVNFQKDSLIKGLPKGSYTITVRDTNGCNQLVKATIAEPTDLKVSIVSTSDASCNKPNGAASVKATGGTKGYTYSWSFNKNLKDSAISNIYSGRYYAIAEDKNKCKDSVVVFINDEDGPKAKQGITTKATCSYSADGTAKIEVNGGNPPYKYIWPTEVKEVDTTYAQKLKGGEYLVEITDQRECKAAVLVKVPAPEALEIVYKYLRNPICENDCNGRAQLTAKGGSGAYSYFWNGSAVSDSNNWSLCEGKHTILLEDKNKCSHTDELTLIAPRLKVELEDSIIICKGQVLNIDAGIDSVKYEWTSNKGYSADTRKVKIKDGGTYYLKVKDNNNCPAYDTMVVVTSTKLLKAKFLMVGKAIVNDTINLIEYSWPVPQTVEWEYPNEFAYLKDDRDWKLFQVTKPGTYTVKLTVSLGECRDELEKEIVVLEESFSDTTSNMKLGFSGIEDVLLFPNPNEGIFTVNIKLTEAMDVEAEVHDLVSVYPMYKTRQSGKDYYTLDLNLLNLTSGAYFLKVKTYNDYKVVKFLIH